MAIRENRDKAKDAICSHASQVEAPPVSPEDRTRRFLVPPATRHFFEALHHSALLDYFLTAWTAHMAETGYLAFTTARRADCTLSLEVFNTALLSVIDDAGEFPTLADLLKARTWTENLLSMAVRHRTRGIPASMFIGCFKTFVAALEDTISHAFLTVDARESAQRCVRRLADAYEILLIDHEGVVDQSALVQQLDETNRKLSLEKCKYENILRAISDMVFVLDKAGLVIEHNESAAQYFKGESLLGQAIWLLFPLKVYSSHELFKNYGDTESASLDKRTVDGQFDITLVSLQAVSLASHAYLMVFTDVSQHIAQKAHLEALVVKRTAALDMEKERLEEMNITLRNVLGTIGQQKSEETGAFFKALKENVLPIIHRLKLEKSAEARDAYLDILEKQVLNISKIGSGHRQNSAALYEMTPVELRVCQMLREGVESKNIARALNLSVETVHTHRKHIRRKLGLQGKGVTLFSYLNSFDLN